MDKKIYSKIDWLSVMCYDTTMTEVLNKIGLDVDYYVDEFLLRQTDMTQGLETKKMFSFEGVNLQISHADYLSNQCSCDTVFDTKFSKVRLDISGRGLDFLRHLGIDVDMFFRNKANYVENFKITRCDFAFDFVNYLPDALDQLIDYCKKNQTAAGKLCLYKVTAGLKYSVREGDQKTLYIGCTGGPQLLRVYDKRLQFYDRGVGAYTKENPYDNPDSWLRFELQTRRERAEGLLFGIPSDNDDSNYWLSVLRFIYDYYAFSENVEGTKTKKKPAEFWLKLWNWDEIPSIIQNENSVEFVSYTQTVLNGISRRPQSFFLGLSVLTHTAHDPDALQHFADHYFSFLFDYSDLRSYKQREAFINRLNVLLAENGLKIYDSLEDVDMPFSFYRDGNVVRWNVRPVKV